MLKEADEILLLSSTRFIKQKEYWAGKLSGLKETRLSALTEVVKGVKGEGEDNQDNSINLVIPDSTTTALLKLSKQSDLSIYIIFHILVKLVLYRYSGEEEQTVISPVYRKESGTRLLNNFLFIRDYIKPEMSFKDALIDCRKSILEAYENQDYPSTKLMEALFDTGTEIEKDPLLPSDVVCVYTAIHDFDKSVFKDRLVFVFEKDQSSNEFNARIHFPLSLCNANFVQAMAEHFVNLMNQAMVEPSIGIREMSLLSQSESKLLLETFNQTALEYPKQDSIIQLFESKVEQTPDRVAVTGELLSEHLYTAYLTYGECNRAANRLANLLRRRGVRPGTVVALLMERSVEMIIAILAVLKAGGAYLPIEPSTPASRLESMLEQCGSPFILTHTDVIEHRSYTHLQGIRRTTRTPVRTAYRQQIKNIDNLPLPDRSMVDYEAYNHFIGVAPVKHRVAIQGTRGCPFRCLYCHRIWPKTHLVRSAENIFKEVKMNYDLGVRRFAFIDDIFNFDIENSSRFFNMLIENNMDVHLFFPNGLRGDILTPDYIDLMVEAGMVNVALALETASPRLQKLLKKNLNIEKLHKNIEYISQNHPQVVLELQTMHGLPSETEEEARMTLDFIKSIKWLHFPYINILKIYPNTEMEELALESGFSREDIAGADSLAHHEIQDYLPFDKNFTLQYQTEFLNQYFLNKERLLHVLPNQMKVLTEDEIVQKYDSYLNTRIEDFDGLLNVAGISRDELGEINFLNEDLMKVPDLNQKYRSLFPQINPVSGALRILLLDLSQFFSQRSHMIYDVVEPPLGLMYLASYLKEEYGERVHCKIAKSRIDFDDYGKLKELLETFKPQVIGIRTLIFHKDFFHQTVALIRQWGVEIPIIAGGPYASSSYETILQDSNIDLAVLGEGEVTFSEVIGKMLESNGTLPPENILNNIPGLAFMPMEERVNSQAQNPVRELVVMDNLNDALLHESSNNPEPINRSENLAYVIFTSGSTGKPKGIMVEHRNLTNLVHGLQEVVYRHLPSPVTVGVVSPYFFDASVKQIFAALSLGHTLAVVPEITRIEPMGFLLFIQKHGLDVSDGTPVHLRLLTEVLEESTAGIPVRRFLIGGEPLTPKALRLFYNQLSAIQGNSSSTDLPVVTNVYGPTECTVDAAYFNVTSAGLDKIQFIPIGVPMPNVNIYILDPHLALLPIGIPGELCIGGHGVARGYIGNTELSEKSFVNHPQFSRLYRSGDKARWNTNGTIQFLGRIDLQVKIRGFRVEVEEIENRLRAHESIREAVVIPRKEVSGDYYLCAYFETLTSEAQEALKTHALREFLLNDLPDYMIPSFFVKLEKLPLTANNKIDRKKLPEPQLGERDEGHVPPRTPLEERLAQIWAKVLDIDKDIIGIDSDFFNLGGHSLKATILVANIHKELDVKIPLVEVFNIPNIRKLSIYIEKAAPELFTAIQPAGERDSYPLSSAQKRMYVLQQMEPQSISYNIPIVLKLEGSIDTERLTRAFQQLVVRHESFRTRFVMAGDKVVQKVEKEVDLMPQLFEAQTGSSSEIDQLIDQFIQPFDLSRAPLMRVGLIKLNSDKLILMVDIHHIISDDPSMTIVMEDFSAFYEGRNLPPLRIQYKDFAVWQSGESEQSQIRMQEQYWLSKFKDRIPLLNIPLDFPRPKRLLFRGDALNFKIEDTLFQTVKQMSANYDVTLNILLLAVYYVFLSKYTGQEDIVIGTPVAGRTHSDLQPIVGFFANMLAMRNKPEKEKSFVSFLKEVKNNTLEAFDNQDYQFDDLVYNLGIPRQPGRHPMIDTVFSLRNIERRNHPGQQENDSEPSGALSVSAQGFENKVSHFDLMLHANVTHNSITMLLEYSEALFKRTTIEEISRCYLEILQQLLKNPELKLEEVSITHHFLTADTSMLVEDNLQFEF